MTLHESFPTSFARMVADTSLAVVLAVPDWHGSTHETKGRGTDLHIERGLDQLRGSSAASLGNASTRGSVGVGQLAPERSRVRCNGSGLWCRAGHGYSSSGAPRQSRADPPRRSTSRTGCR